MFRKLKKLFSAQYSHFRPSIHNIVKYPCKKDICQKIFFYSGEIKNNYFSPSITISALVYITLWNTLVEKIFTKKTLFFMLGKLRIIFSAQHNHFRPSIHNIAKYACKKYFIFQEKITSFLFAPSSLFSQSGGAFRRRFSAGDLLSPRAFDF